ncbi:hypothetical protein CATMQ487_19470 [Sphaerotilus microaerophilus]|uniref:Prevent-host-death protein n=2 Tax=Sphaerotilus microaerophilus TaxID=2914710 RepID=A0ABM7YKL9_9BURK|nr:hypothetical protein CATMQ487_19470 [Sphaerotilus sp. FB-5]
MVEQAGVGPGGRTAECPGSPHAAHGAAPIAVHLHYIPDMKTAAIPSIRVEPALREQLEQVLAEGESLSAFVEASVRAQVQRRQQQAEFVARGMASLDAVRQGAPTLTLDESMQALKRRIAAARVRAAGQAPA